MSKCKTRCGRLARTDGFCGTCYIKYRKGDLLEDGQKSGALKAKEKKEKEKEKRKVLKTIKKKKERLSEELTKNHLEVLKEKPEYTEVKGCPLYNFWTSDVICFNRLYVDKRRKCLKCTVHNDKVDVLIDLLEDKDGKA